MSRSSQKWLFPKTDFLDFPGSILVFFFFWKNYLNKKLLKTSFFIKKKVIFNINVRRFVSLKSDHDPSKWVFLENTAFFEEISMA